MQEPDRDGHLHMVFFYQFLAYVLHVPYSATLQSLHKPRYNMQDSCDIVPM